MQIRKLTKYAVLSISVLSASLLKEYIIKYISLQYKEHTYLSVAITMLITIVVFVPLLGLVDGYLKKASRGYIKSSKAISGSSRKGLFLGFVVAMVILYIFFAKTRHNIDVIHDLKVFIQKK